MPVFDLLVIVGSIWVRRDDSHRDIVWHCLLDERQRTNKEHYRFPSVWIMHLASCFGMLFFHGFITRSCSSSSSL